MCALTVATSSSLNHSYFLFSSVSQTVQEQTSLPPLVLPACSLHVPSVLPACSLRAPSSRAPCVLPACSLRAPCMFPPCSLRYSPSLAVLGRWKLPLTEGGRKSGLSAQFQLLVAHDLEQRGLSSVRHLWSLRKLTGHLGPDGPFHVADGVATSDGSGRRNSPSARQGHSSSILHFLSHHPPPPHSASVDAGKWAPAHPPLLYLGP